jgi:hypothetical protein
MSRAALDRFREIVFQDTALQQRLLDAPHLSAFLERTLQAATEYDCDVSADEIKSMMTDHLRGWLGRWK